MQAQHPANIYHPVEHQRGTSSAWCSCTLDTSILLPGKGQIGWLHLHALPVVLVYYMQTCRTSQGGNEVVTAGLPYKMVLCLIPIRISF